MGQKFHSIFVGINEARIGKERVSFAQIWKMSIPFLESDRFLPMLEYLNLTMKNDKSTN